MGEHSRRRVVGAAAVTGMVVAGIVGVASLSVSGQTPPPPAEATQPVLAPYGTLTINLTDRGGTYTLVNSQGVNITPSPETIVTSQPCATVEPGTGELLILTPNPASPTSALDTVQVRNSGFGINTGNTSCGSSAAALISGDEQLRLELGPAIPEGVFAKSASLLVTQNKKGNLRWTLDDGALSVATTIDQSPQVVPVTPQINTLDDLFSSITLQSTSTKSNEGLSLFDGTSFELVTIDPDFDVAVDCGEQVTEIGDDGDIATSAIFFRGENGSKTTGPCVDVGVIVKIESSDTEETPGWVFWDNSNLGVDGTPQAVNGTVTIEWAPVLVADADQLERVIDYDGDGEFTESLWCLSFDSDTDVDGKVTFDVVLPNYGGPGSILVGDVPKAPWCLVSDERILQDDGTIIQTEVLFGSGDPRRSSPS